MAINYTPVGWDTAKYVNPTNMNHMDDGIKAACDGVDAVNENLKSIHEKYITTDASGTVIENTELATFLLRNIGSVPANGTKTIDYVNSAGQSGSFVVSKMSDVYFSGLYFTPFMSRPCYFTHNNGTWTWEELAKNSDLELKKVAIDKRANEYVDLIDNNSYCYVKNGICYLQLAVTITETYSGWIKVGAISVAPLEGVGDILFPSNCTSGGIQSYARIGTDGSVYTFPNTGAGTIQVANISFPCRYL